MSTYRNLLLRLFFVTFLVGILMGSVVAQAFSQQIKQVPKRVFVRQQTMGLEKGPSAPLEVQIADSYGEPIGKAELYIAQRPPLHSTGIGLIKTEVVGAGKQQLCAVADGYMPQCVAIDFRTGYRYEVLFKLLSDAESMLTDPEEGDYKTL